MDPDKNASFIARDSRNQILDVKRQIILFQTIQNPRLREIVTTFHIQLAPTDSCKKSKTLFSPQYGFSCPCDKLDSKLGQALRGLKSLVDLRIVCRLCPKSDNTHRHRFFKELQLNSLAVLRLACTCSSSLTAVNLKVAVPESLHTLEWCCNPGILPFILAENQAAPPELKTLCTSSAKFLATMLTKCSLSNVRAISWDQSIHEAATESPYQGSLQYLSVLGLRSPFTFLISQDLRPYMNLQQLGQFHHVTYDVSTP